MRSKEETEKILGELSISLKDSVDVEEAKEALKKVTGLVPVVVFLKYLLEFLKPSPDMDSISAVYGFALAIQIAVRFPEWAKAFDIRTSQESPSSPGEDMFREFVDMMPLSIEQEIPNAD